MYKLYWIDENGLNRQALLETPNFGIARLVCAHEIENTPVSGDTLNVTSRAFSTAWGKRLSNHLDNSESLGTIRAVIVMVKVDMHIMFEFPSRINPSSTIRLLILEQEDKLASP